MKPILKLLDLNDPNFPLLGQRHQIEHVPTGIRRGYKSRNLARLVLKILRKRTLGQDIAIEFETALEEANVLLRNTTNKDS